MARGSVHHPLDALGSMVPARANQMVHVEEEPQSRAPGPTVWTPLHPLMGPKPAHVPGVGKLPKSGKWEGIKQTLLFSFR